MRFSFLRYYNEVIWKRQVASVDISFAVTENLRFGQIFHPLTGMLYYKYNYIGQFVTILSVNKTRRFLDGRFALIFCLRARIVRIFIIEVFL